MLKRQAIAAVFMVILVNPVQAITVQKYLQNKDQPGYDIYFVGLSDGLYWANSASAADGAPLYCAPDNLAVVPEQYESILERYVEQSLVSTDQAEVGMVLQFALQDAFPC